MELFSSMLSIVKNVSDTDRQFKMFREKLLYHIKKGETALAKFKSEKHSLTFFSQNLQAKLMDGYEKLKQVQNLLNSDATNKGLSIKQKFKLSLPFNNAKDKITSTIEQLRYATQEILNNNLTEENGNQGKKRLQYQIPHPEDDILDDDQIDLMGPTIQQNNALDFAQEIMKKHTVQLIVEMCGDEKILKVIEQSNRFVTKVETRQRAATQQFVPLFTLGRINFKQQYKILKPIYPDIDKISKNCHFTLRWKRTIYLNQHKLPKKQVHPKEQQSKIQQPAQEEKNQIPEDVSQKKQEADLFFSLPQVSLSQFDNGMILLQREQGRCLYKYRGGQWIKQVQNSVEIMNGQKVAISLNKQQIPDLYFKLNYKWK